MQDTGHDMQRVYRGSAEVLRFSRGGVEQVQVLVLVLVQSRSRGRCRCADTEVQMCKEEGAEVKRCIEGAELVQRFSRGGDCAGD